MAWKSIAKWPYPEVRLGNTENLSEDTHDTPEMALAVARRLREEGFGGDGKIFPLKVWVIPATPLPQRVPVNKAAKRRSPLRIIR